MKNITKCLALMFIISFGFISPSYCKDQTSSKVYEQALLKYVLAYEAFQQAKQDPNKRAQLPLYIRKYRESYAQYLQLMRENDLYDPTNDEKLNDPVGNFNKLRKHHNKPKKRFKPVDTSKARQKVREKVDSGEDPESIVEETAANTVPEKGYSDVDYEEAGWDPNNPYCDIPEEWDSAWGYPEWWVPEDKRPNYCANSPTKKHEWEQTKSVNDNPNSSDIANTVVRCTYCGATL